MNDENLIPNKKRTPSELREITQKGGIASGKSRRQKKALRSILKESLNLQLKDIADKGTRDLLLEAVGAENEDRTVGELIIDGLILSSIRGNSQMMKLLFELIGEDPTITLKKQELALKKKAVEKAESGDTATSLGMMQLVESLKVGD